MATSVATAASRKHVELSLELKRKLIQEHEHGVPFTLLGKKYHIATSTAANIWRKKDFFLRSRMSGSRKRCNDRSKYKIVNQVTALFVKSMLERNHKIDGEVIKRFARTAAAQCNFKDFHGSNGWLDSFKKRENVCWVRRRGERPVPALLAPDTLSASSSSAAGGATGVLAENPTAFATTSTRVTSTSTASENNACGGGGATGAIERPLACRQSDSPNLSVAAAAAAVAATASHKHDHEHHRQHYSSQRQSLASSPTSSSSSLRCARDDEQLVCARCSVAAAAAAVAALNSADSLHEREHEIEDWFHGIPFLCQFFEEHQSVHQQQADSSAANAAGRGAQTSLAATSCPNEQLYRQQQSGGFQQQHESALHAPPGRHEQQLQSSAAAANSIESQVCVNFVSTATTTTMPIGQQSISSGAAVEMQQVELHATRQQPPQPFRTSASLADIHSVCASLSGGQQKATSCAANSTTSLQRTMSTEMLDHLDQVEQFAAAATAGEQQEADYSAKAFPQRPRQDFPMRMAQSCGGGASSAATSLANTNTSGSNEHLMEIVNYADEQQTRLSRNSSSQLMDLVGGGAERLANQLGRYQQPLVDKSAGGACQHSAQLAASCDYNSDDQEFYLPATRYSLGQDAHSDELLYHDEVSDHNDCCSDHYEPGGGRNAELASLHDYQVELGAASSAAAGACGSNQNGACYIDEYEYENISTIRHYPLPMASQQQSGGLAAAAAGPSAQFAALGATNDSPFDGRNEQPQRQGGNNNNCQQQPQRQQLGGQQAPFVTTPTAAGQQQQLAAAENYRQQPQTDYPTCLVGLADCEQSVEHADHEEHNLLHNALMRSPEKLKLIDSIITLLNYASNYNQKMLAPLLEIKRCIERDLEVVLSDTSSSQQQQQLGQQQLKREAETIN